MEFRGGVWVSDCRVRGDPVYYRIHDGRIIHVLFVYDSTKDKWAECKEDFNEHTKRLREEFHPGVETIKLSKAEMLMVANGGFDELTRDDAAEWLENTKRWLK